MYQLHIIISGDQMKKIEMDEANLRQTDRKENPSVDGSIISKRILKHGYGLHELD